MGYTLHTDHLGSIRLVTNASKQVVSRHTYLPFGHEVGSLTKTPTTHKFTGHERDPEINLDYMLARYYSAGMGRFGSVDPARESVDLAEAQSWNRYVYASNNPVAFLDPDGESSLRFDGKAKSLTLYSKSGQVLGSWKAANNVQNKNRKGKWEDGTYKMRDQNAPYKHGGTQDTPKGEYGSHGIFRAETFIESNGNRRTTMGVHSGREGVKDGATPPREGVEHATNGCIRTTDDAMATIEDTAKADPLETITVESNKAPQTSSGGKFRVSGSTNGGSGVTLIYNGMPINIH